MGEKKVGIGRETLCNSVAQHTSIHHTSRITLLLLHHTCIHVHVRVHHTSHITPAHITYCMRYITHHSVMHVHVYTSHLHTSIELSARVITRKWDNGMNSISLILGYEATCPPGRMNVCSDL